MNRAERRAKNTAWKVKNKLRGERNKAEEALWKLYRDRLRKYWNSVVDDATMEHLLREPKATNIDEAKRTPAQTASTHQERDCEAQR